jgi:hypothetical protein
MLNRRGVFPKACMLCLILFCWQGGCLQKRTLRDWTAGLTYAAVSSQVVLLSDQFSTQASAANCQVQHPGQLRLFAENAEAASAALLVRWCRRHGALQKFRPVDNDAFSKICRIEDRSVAHMISFDPGDDDRS